MSELKSEFVIDGKIVEKDDSISQLTIYKLDMDLMDAIKFYFVNSQTNKVVKTLIVTADCGQDQGYISSHEWSK